MGLAASSTREDTLTQRKLELQYQLDQLRQRLTLLENLIKTNGSNAELNSLRQMVRQQIQTLESQYEAVDAELNQAKSEFDLLKNNEAIKLKPATPEVKVTEEKPSEPEFYNGNFNINFSDSTILAVIFGAIATLLTAIAAILAAFRRAS